MVGKIWKKTSATFQLVGLRGYLFVNSNSTNIPHSSVREKKTKSCEYNYVPSRNSITEFNVIWWHKRDEISEWLLYRSILNRIERRVSKKIWFYFIFFFFSFSILNFSVPCSDLRFIVEIFRFLCKIIFNIFWIFRILI